MTLLSIFKAIVCQLLLTFSFISDRHREQAFFSVSCRLAKPLRQLELRKRRGPKDRCDGAQGVNLVSWASGQFCSRLSWGALGRARAAGSKAAAKIWRDRREEDCGRGAAVPAAVLCSGSGLLRKCTGREVKMHC